MYDINEIRSAWVEINLDCLEHNIKEVRRLTSKDSLVTAVIKADGYGHGAKKIAKTLINNGADRIAVAVLDEAIELRQEGFEDIPILILGYTDPKLANKVIEYNLQQTVYSWKLAEALSIEAEKKGKTGVVHIKIDSGMGRIGLIPSDESVKLIKKICSLQFLHVEGIYTHFAVADEVDKRYTENQYKNFLWICNELERQGIFIKLKHCGNSATIIDLPQFHVNMVRAGIMLYGLAPSKDVMLDKVQLKQVMSLKARVSHVKQIDEGQSVSYGRRFIAQEKTIIASLPLGYADGFSRLLTGKAEALVKGKRVPVVGTICMDQSMIDVTSIKDVKVGDEVVLFGAQDKNFISIDEVANKLGTINYEIVCMIAKRVPRVYIKNNEIVDVMNNLYDL